MHGEVPLAGLERYTLRDRPGEENTVALEAKVVVETARIMTLDDEDGPPLATLPPPEWLGGFLAVALALVVAEGRHGRMFIRLGPG